MYPNPFESRFVFNITLSDPATVSYEIRNTLGQLVVKKGQRFSGGSSREEIDLTGQPAGMYLVTVKVNDRITHSRLLKY
jgi:hypothetical protein